MLPEKTNNVRSSKSCVYSWLYPVKVNAIAVLHSCYQPFVDWC